MHYVEDCFSESFNKGLSINVLTNLHKALEVHFMGNFYLYQFIVAQVFLDKTLTVNDLQQTSSISVRILF